MLSARENGSTSSHSVRTGGVPPAADGAPDGKGPLSVCLIVPYLGGLPPWLPLFLQSAGHNSSIDICLITDHEVRYPRPPNVRYLQMSLADIEARLRVKVADRARLRWPYKLCDLKPFYGLVFDDLTRGYEFWGYCDLDLVLGDLSNVIRPGRLDGVDFYSADAGPVVGHFCLYRNCARVNAFVLGLPGYVDQLSDPDYRSLDEIQLERALSTSGDIAVGKARGLAESQLTVSAEGRMVGRTAGVVGTPVEFFWSHGRTFIKSDAGAVQEVLYLHFMGLKRSYHWTGFDPAVKYDEFGFSAAGFEKRGAPDSRRARVRQALRRRRVLAVSRGRHVVAACLPNQARWWLKAQIARFGGRRFL